MRTRRDRYHSRSPVPQPRAAVEPAGCPLILMHSFPEYGQVPRIGLVTLVVREYDEAVRFYVDVLGFEVLEDTPLGNDWRWVVIAPAGGSGTALLLARASTDAQRSRVGDQSGGRVSFFLTTDDFARDHHRMQNAGVHMIEQPRRETYGTVVVFEDLYGNRWDLIERPPGP